MSNTKIKTLLFFCSLLLMCCHKHEDCEKPTGLTGEWTWIESVGGIGGWTETPESEKVTKKLIIDNFIFKEYVNDSLVFESEYHLGISEETLLGTEEKTYIEFKSGGQRAILIGESELELIEQCYDCFFHKYKRK